MFPFIVMLFPHSQTLKLFRKVVLITNYEPKKVESRKSKVEIFGLR